MPPAATARFAELTTDYAAVAEVALPAGLTSFVCRTAGGIAHVEVIDRAGDQLEPAAALKAIAGNRRALAQAAEQMTDHALAHVALRQRAGEDVNLAELARELGVARQTIYNRLDALHIAPAARAAA